MTSLASYDKFKPKVIFPFKTLDSNFHYNLQGSLNVYYGVNGALPCNISYINTPKLHISNLLLCPVPKIISGDK